MQGAERCKFFFAVKTFFSSCFQSSILFNSICLLKFCISCNKPPKKENAGHYYSQGGHSAVRFDEDNVHLQCEACNTYLSGNLLNYQIGIKERIGAQRLMELQAKAHEVKKWTKDELKQIIEIYKQKLK